MQIDRGCFLVMTAAVGCASATTTSQPGVDASATDAAADAAADVDDFDGGIRTTDETQYLDFGLSYVGLFDATGSGAGEAPKIRAIIDKAVADLVAKVGATGDGESRQLGFMILLPPWVLEVVTPGKLANVIAQATDVALSRRVALHLTLESHYFWGARADLWNFWDPSSPGYDPKNSANVEWSDWKGTAVNYRYLDWGAPEKLDAPHMCYLAPKIQTEVARLGGIFGAAVKAATDAFAAAGHPELFSGVTVGSEPSLDNYEHVDDFDPPLGKMMSADGAAKVRLGYCSFTAMGYSAASPPASLNAAAADANRRFLESWAKALASAGVPKTRLYTHIGASAVGATLDFTNAPIDVAFVDSARPGWSSYPWTQLTKDFTPLTAALAAHGNPHWGGTEAAPFDGTSAVPVYEYLRRHYDAGATVVVMNTGATGALGDPLAKAVYGPDAIAAYVRFLTRR